MINFNYLKLFIVYIVIQIFILNEVIFSSYIIPFLYLTIILSIPKGKSILFLMIISFMTGLTIDIFEGQLGLHSTSCLIIAFLRPKILSILSNSKTLSSEDNIRLNNLGALQFLVYSSTLIFFHSLILFFIIDFEIGNIFNLIMKTILSTIVTLVLIFVNELYYSNKQ
tara:strand:+ start:637 stop:1140 length:504 start_codon:yes stop_codon:yes gene_type:complete